MFPPEPIEKPEDWLNNLAASLQRAGGHFSGEARIFPQEDEELEAVLYLRDTIPSNGVTALKAYIRQYSRACGWRVTTVRVTANYVVFRASSEESKDSKNP